MNKTVKTAVAVGGGLLLVYLLLLPMAVKGWGYSGYGGYHAGPSFFYWGGGRTDHYRGGPSARQGSLGGTSQSGGGPGRGK